MRVRLEHWQLLLMYCRSHPEIITNKFVGTDGKAKGNALWQTLVQRLNDLGFGEKTTDAWKKALTDWKSKTKAKAAALKREAQRTGGGPPELPPLSALEEELLSILGEKSTFGDEEVSELGCGQVEVHDNTQSQPFKELLINTNQQPGSSNEHNYSTFSVSRKRKIHEENETPKIPKLRRRKNTFQSEDLLELNEKTVSILENIDKNTAIIARSMESMAESLKALASAIKSNYTH